MSKQWTAEEILSLVRAFQPACILIAAAELDIFTVLYKRPMTAKCLALELKSDTHATTVLLNSLAALGLLIKQGNLYSIRPETAEILTETGTRSILPAVRHLGNCLSC